MRHTQWERNSIVAFSLIVAAPIFASPPVGTANRVPDGLSATDWSSILAAYERNRLAAFSIEGEYVARNPGQQWRTRFDGRGFLTTPDAGGWSWGMALMSYGRAAEEKTVATPDCIDVVGGRVEYQWDESLTEWYVNDPRGLEHGYTVHRRPARHLSEIGAGDRDQLQFALAVRGDLHPRIDADDRGLTFVNDVGAAVVNYTGLKVFDTDGASVPAWFELAGGSVVLCVDDSAARYPLTIDPTAQQAYLKASNTDGGDWFGYSVAVSGNSVIVGAPGESSSDTGVNGSHQDDDSMLMSGAAYVFVRSPGGAWSQQAYLKASNTQDGDRFGFSVAISGDTVVVGAWSEDSNARGVNGDQTNNSATDAGAAYVFVRSGTNWSQQAYLKASNTEAIDFPGPDYFGYSVAVSGDTVVVGAYGEWSSAVGVNGDQSDNNAAGSGATYVFVRSAGVWSQQAYLKASNTGVGDSFGFSVAVSGDTVAVGAFNEASNAMGVNGNQFSNSAFASGAVYIFVRSSGVWSQQAYVKASNTGAGDRLGYSVSVSGDTVVAGAYLEDSSSTGVNGIQANNSATDSGAAYVFVRSGGVWSQQAYLKASNTESTDRFGFSVAVSDNTVVVGAYQEDSNATGVNGIQTNNSAGNSGAAYLFTRSGTIWSQQAYIKASNTELNDYFGYAVAASGDTVVIGAYQESSSATGVNGDQSNNTAPGAGATYVYSTGVSCPMLGNMNCDCVVDGGDIGAFVLALLDPDGYADSYPSCDILRADMQSDGEVNGADIQAFVALLIS